MSKLDRFNFIEFANNKPEMYKDIYSGFPKGSEPLSSSLPSINHPIPSASIDFFYDCIGPGFCLIPDRMPVFFASVRNSVQNILQHIISNNGQLAESEDLQFFIDLRSIYVKKYAVSDGRLSETTEILSEDRYKAFFVPYWLQLVCDSLINFLLTGDLIKLKKCSDCNHFFLLRKKYPHQKYCSVCSKKNHTPKEVQRKRTQASREAKKKRKDKDKRKKLFDSQYKRLIEAGYSKKEAKQEAEKFVIEQLL